MPENKVRKNTDYSASAINLTNSPQVEGLLRELQNCQTAMVQLRNKAEALIPENIKVEIKRVEELSNKLSGDIRQAIDEFGSFQDVDKGWYALKQKRESITYKPELVRQHLHSKFHSLVIVESIDGKAFDGLIKGGMVTPEKARECGEVKETFAYIIR